MFFSQYLKYVTGETLRRKRRNAQGNQRNTDRNIPKDQGKGIYVCILTK